MKMCFSVCSFLAALIVSGASASAQNAPAQLRGKTVTVSWTENRMQRKVGEEESFRPRSVPQSLIVYVSANGRAFARRSAVNAKGRSGSHDSVGNQGESNSGGARVTRFSGRSLNVTASIGSAGARSISVTFDDSFSGCSAHVIVGSAGGRTIRAKSLVTGAAIEIQDTSAGGESCSIRDGNAFAN